jgi:AbrB family looped-hinge helix DNA binding protein
MALPQGTVSEKGWVVIPKEIRDRLVLKKGSKVDFVDLGGHVYFKKTVDDPIAAARGLFKGRLSMEDYLAEKQREREEEDAL